MNTIKNSLSKVLTIAVVVLTVIVTFAIHPSEALAGYCCTGDYTQITPDYPTCKVDYARGYEYKEALLSNDSKTTAKVEEKKTGSVITINKYDAEFVELPHHETFTLVEGTGRVVFDCFK
ncbi:hypothetical protein [Moorena producens]|uniref:hypothetical protein n=1 Tax=Moorena producens TaxID=1155739 RepID=UPI003C769802